MERLGVAATKVLPSSFLAAMLIILELLASGYGVAMESIFFHCAGRLSGVHCYHDL